MTDQFLVTRPGEKGYIEPGSPEYRAVLGCSSVAAALGVPGARKTPMEVWRYMTHRAPDTEHKKIFDRGHAMESFVAAKLMEQYGRTVKSEQVQYRDPDRPWLVFHADGMFPLHTPLRAGDRKREGPGVHEAKAPGFHMTEKMAREGMTPDYICQMQLGMHIAGMAMGLPIAWSTASFLDYDAWEVEAFDIDADWSFQKAALKRLDAFYECVLTDTPPESPLAKDALVVPEVNGEKQVITEGRLVELSQKLAPLIESVKQATALDKMLRAEIKALIEPFEYVEIPGLIKYTYTRSKPGQKIDGEGLLTYCEWLIGKYTKLVNEIVEIEANMAEPTPIIFDRSQWVTQTAGTRSMRPTLIGGK